jgi:hypothetical protein
MVAILAAVAMLSVGLVVVPIQQASAQDTSFSIKHSLMHVALLLAVAIPAQ